MKVGKENVYDRIDCSGCSTDNTAIKIWFNFFLQFWVLLLCFLVVAQCQDELPVVDEFNPFFFTGTYYLVSFVNLKTVHFVDSNVLIVMVVSQPLRFKWMSWMATIINWQNHYIIKKGIGLLEKWKHHYRINYVDIWILFSQMYTSQYVAELIEGECVQGNCKCCETFCRWA